MASLASIGVSEEDVASLAGELSVIVDYVRQLETLESMPGMPSASSDTLASLRSDEPLPCLDRDDALRAAPAASAEGFTVPPFLRTR